MGLIQRIEKIKASADLLRYVQSDGVDMKPDAGGRFKGCCPFHEEKTGSFTIYPEEQRFYCFGSGCGKKGSVLDYVMYRQGLDLKAAVDFLGEMLGIPREESQRPAGPTMDEMLARRIAQEYFVRNLREHPELKAAREWLQNRNVMPEDWERWGIGASTGTAITDLADRIDQGTMVSIGILGHKDASDTYDGNKLVLTKPSRRWDWIKPGWLTFPVHNDSRAVCYWYLRDPENKQCYQIKGEKRAPGAHFFNQPAIVQNERLYIVEGPFEVIQIAKHGAPAAASLGTIRSNHIEYLKAKRQGDPHFPELVKKKTLILWGDRDSNASGQTATVKAACLLFQFHDILIAKNEMGKDADGSDISKDPDDYLREGGKLDALIVTPHTQSSHDIEPTHDGYLITRYPKKGDPYPDMLTNFLVDVKYQFIGDREDLMRMVQITRNGTRTRPILLAGKDIYCRPAMMQWLASKSGDAALHGDAEDFEQLMRFIRETDRSDTITMTKQYGLINPDTWVYDDGCVHKGEIIKSGKDGIIPVEIDGRKGLRTTAGTDLQEKEFKAQRLPKHPVEIGEVIQKTAHFYPGYMSKTLIGWAAASIMQDVFVDYYECFPHLMFLGRSNRGKTKGQRWVQSMCGAGNVPTNTCRSTKPSFMRHAMQFCNMPVPFSEYTGQFEETLRDWYDRNLYSKAKGDGMETVNPIVRASCTFTTMGTPTGESLLNRCVILDYNRFAYDRDKKQAYDETFQAMVLAGGGFGFLLGILRSNLRDHVLDGAQQISKLLLKHEGLRGSEDRLITTYSVVYGTFWAMYNDQGPIGDVMRRTFRHGSRDITIQDLIQEIESVVANVERIVRGQDVMQIFFEYLRQLHVSGDLDNHLVIAPVGGPPSFVRFNLGDCFNLVRAYDNRTKEAMKHVTKNDIESQIRDVFDIRSTTGRIDGIVQSCYSISLMKIREVYGVSFQSIKDAPEEEDAIHHSDAVEPPPEEIPAEAVLFDPEELEGQE